MLEQILAIIRNTFSESIRQPIMLVLIVVATILIILSNPLAGFTMDDDQKMLVDVGLATVFLFGALLAAMIATSVLTREIENKTALTVVSKPVGRPLFVVGKFLGVACALLLAMSYIGLVFLLVDMHGVLQTARDPLHRPVITFGVLAGVIGVGTGVWCNYFYGKPFTSIAISATTPLVALAYFLAMMFAHDFSMLAPSAWTFKPHLWMALIAIMMAVLVLTAVAIAASTRLTQTMTLAVTLGVFMLGMLSDWFFGRRLANLRGIWEQRAVEAGVAETVERTRTITLITGEQSPPITDEIIVVSESLFRFAQWGELLAYAFVKMLYSIVPNFQMMLLIDAVTQGHRIPASYLWSALSYGALCIVAALALAVILFQRREVG